MRAANTCATAILLNGPLSSVRIGHAHDRPHLRKRPSGSSQYRSAITRRPPAASSSSSGKHDLEAFPRQGRPGSRLAMAVQADDHHGLGGRGLVRGLEDIEVVIGPKDGVVRNPLDLRAIPRDMIGHRLLKPLELTGSLHGFRSESRQRDVGRHLVLRVSTVSASGLHLSIEEVTLEPCAGQLGNPLQGARLFKEMPCPGHDLEVGFGAHLR